MPQQRTSQLRTGFAPRTGGRRTTRSAGSNRRTTTRANEAAVTAPRSHVNARDAWQHLENALANNPAMTKEQLERELRRHGFYGDVIGLMTSVRQNGGVVVRSVVSKQYTATPSGIEIIGELNKRLRMIFAYGANIRGLRSWYQQNRREIDRHLNDDQRGLLHALSQCHEELFNYIVARQTHHNL